MDFWISCDLWKTDESCFHMRQLPRRDGAWKVDDIDYGENGKLTSFLK